MRTSWSSSLVLAYFLENILDTHTTMLRLAVFFFFLGNIFKANGSSEFRSTRSLNGVWSRSWLHSSNSKPRHWRAKFSRNTKFQDWKQSRELRIAIRARVIIGYTCAKSAEPFLFRLWHSYPTCFLVNSRLPIVCHESDVWKNNVFIPYFHLLNLGF